MRACSVRHIFLNELSGDTGLKLLRFADADGMQHASIIRCILSNLPALKEFNVKKLCLVWIAVVTLSSFSMVGCGGSGSTDVIQETPPAAPEMTDAEKAAYAKSMKESMK